MSSDRTKPQLHVSALTMLQRCGEQFRRRYIVGEVVPPSVALAVGTATHRSIEANLRHKAEHGEMLLADEVSDIAAQSFLAEAEKGLVLDGEDRDRGMVGAKADGVDTAVALAKLHRDELAPTITPKSPLHVERKWVVEMPESPMDLAGTIDIDEGDAIRDTKTAAKSPAAGDADKSVQMTAYAVAKKIIDGEFPRALHIDYLIKTKTPKTVTQTTGRDMADAEMFLARVSRAAEIITAGAFTPANTTDWWCSAKFCGYHSTCPFAAGRKTVGYTGGVSHGG